jgi:hypothetical protein
MIELLNTDEYGSLYAIDTFLTIEDAKFALDQMLTSLEDARTGSEIERLHSLINQLKDLIHEAETKDEDAF